MPDYTSLFTAIGKYVKAANQLQMWAESSETFTSGGQTFAAADVLLSGFASVLDGSADERARLDRLGDLLSSAAASIGAARRAILADLDAYLTTVARAELGDTSPAAAGVVDALARSMLADSETVAANDVSVGSPVPLRPGGNTGDGMLAVWIQSDDGTGTQADDPRVAGRAVTVRVVRDAPRDRVAAGSEEFAVETSDGLQTTAIAFGATGYAGANPSSGNRIDNGSFESFTADLPDGFDAALGTPGTHIFEDDTTSFVGGASLKLVGNGSIAEIALTQDLSELDPPLIPGDLAVVSAAVKASGVTTGTIRIALEGTGYSAANAIEIAAAWPAGWTQLAAFELLPRPLPPDLRLRVSFSGTPNSGATVWVDHVVAGTPARIERAGLALAVLSGPEPFLGGPIPDGFAFETTSDDAGRFQTFFRDVYGRGLPSTDGTPTVDDSLAS